MQNDNRPLYSLTVEEFKELSKSIAIENSINSHVHLTQVQEKKSLNDIIYIDDVSLLTGYKKNTVYTKVCRRQIPIISNGRPLTFSKEEIVQWMKSGRPSNAEMKSKQIISNFNKKG
jgi:predicted DNA-binding transcriptional regulator AlpA